MCFLKFPTKVDTMNGTEIRNARERAGLTQEELGELVGVSGRTVGNWERGKSIPRNKLAKLRVVLDVADERIEQNPLLEVSDATLLAEIARRFDAGRQREEEGDGVEEATPLKRAAVSAATDETEEAINFIDKKKQLRTDTAPSDPAEFARFLESKAAKKGRNQGQRLKEESSQRGEESQDT